MELRAKDINRKAPRKGKGPSHTTRRSVDQGGGRNGLQRKRASFHYSTVRYVSIRYVTKHDPLSHTADD